MRRSTKEATVHFSDQGGPPFLQSTPRSSETSRSCGATYWGVCVLVLLASFLGPISKAAGQGLNQMVGDWVHDNSGEAVKIEPNQLDGWNVWFGNVGRGRITSATVEFGANVRA